MTENEIENQEEGIMRQNIKKWNYLDKESFFHIVTFLGRKM